MEITNIRVYSRSCCGGELRLSVSTVETIVTFAGKSAAKSADESFGFFPSFVSFLEDFVVQPSSLTSTFDFGALPPLAFFAPFLPFFADLMFVGASEGDWEGEHDGRDEGISDGADDNDGCSEGTSVGTVDGNDDGKDDGSFEGIEDGINVGKEDGKEDGIIVGLEDGIIDGNEDGKDDGFFDGIIDGIIDGEEDGIEDGFIDGKEDGKEDGSFEGIEVTVGVVVLCPRQGFPSKSIAESVSYFIVNFMLPRSYCRLQFVLQVKVAWLLEKY